MNPTAIHGTDAPWDASASYPAGVVIQRSGHNWQATRAITGSIWPWSTGEVPGISDAWRDMGPVAHVFGKGGGGGGHHHGGHHGHGGGWGWGPWGYTDEYLFEDDDGYEIKVVNGETVIVPRRSYIPTAIVLGMVDVGAWATQMNALKQVPVSVARILLKSGEDAIVRAKQVAQQADLPGGTERDNVLWKLKWHEEALAKISDPNAMYASGADLKKWVLAAYVDANAVEEGAIWINQAWARMWAEIATAISALPAKIAAKVNETAGALFGMPGWVVGVSALGIAGLLGVVYVKTIAKGHSKALGGR